ncbi:hypothetical protein BG015_009215 [Linnemannia schmuckeri]|uniref:Uncharacterized protein n=1 Tax=Linnemannia schmuckeri TaxID=64567 RepID=A0A9P5V9I3_9FUNG|nr:hypothetical protein BG015_009215 [Linnemannia schmuckeri]
MKFTSSILLISAAIASVASAIPLAGQATGKVNVHNTVQGNANAYFARIPLTKRCNDCTHKDGAALNAIIKASADHYADIAQARLDNLMNEIATAKVTSGTEELPREKALLTDTVQINIDNAKKACTPEELVPAIKSAVEADDNLNIAWSKQEDQELKKKMAELEVMIMKMVLDRIQANIDAESLSRDCTEKMTNTEIAPAPESPETPAPTLEAPAPVPETPAPVPETPTPAPEAPAPVPETLAPAPETPAPVPEALALVPQTYVPTPAVPAPIPETPAPAPETPAPVPEALAPIPETSGCTPEAPALVPETPTFAPETSAPVSETLAPVSENINNNDVNELTPGIDVAANVDPKYVCKSGCNDSQDAKNVLGLRVNLEKELKSRLDYFFAEEVPTACEEKSTSLLDGVLHLLSGL